MSSSESCSAKTVIRALLVDDDVSFSEVAKKLLNEIDSSLEIDLAPDVDEARHKLSENSYDAVISDYEMPKKNGLEFLKELRGEGNEVPFILFTGKGREEVAIQALNLGADGYINKYGHPETVYGELTHNLKAIVARKKAEELLRKNEAELRGIFESAPDLVMILDRDLRFVRVNRVIFGSGTPEDLVGKSAIEVLPSAARQLVQSRIEECFATGKMQVFEHVMDGRTVLARVVPIKLAGKISQLAIYSTDINKRYQELTKLVKAQNFS